MFQHLSLADFSVILTVFESRNQAQELCEGLYGRRIYTVCMINIYICYNREFRRRSGVSGVFTLSAFGQKHYSLRVYRVPRYVHTFSIYGN